MKKGLSILALIALAAAAIWYSLTPQFPVALGLDLKGGMRVTLEPDPTKEGGTNVPAETMKQVRDVIEKRVNSFGLAGADVRLKSTLDGQQQILVLLPGARNPDEALTLISTVAQLEFRHLQNVQSERNPSARYKMNVVPGDAERGEPDTYQFLDTENGNKEVPQEQVLGESQLVVKGDSLRATSEAQLNPTTAQPYVSFEFKPDGARAFGTFTTESVDEILAVVLDNKIISAPTINEPITDGRGQISGGFRNMAEARVLANLLNSGALPIPLRPAETQVVGATLGQESIERSIQAGLIGLGLVLVFMLAYYWLPGLLACLALVFYAALNFAIFKGLGIFPPIVLDLPGITGFILSVGMAVDANILIFERLKEELKAGKNIHAAVDTGFSRAFSAILDSNVTTWIVCAILIWLGAPIIKGFAITLAIGVAVSMFTAITVTRTLLHLVMDMPWARNERLYGLNVSWIGLFFPASRQGAILPVYSKRKVYYGLSILAGVVALAFAAMTPFGMGLKPGIDFTGGTVVESAFFNPNVNREEVVKALSTAGVNEATVSIARSEQTWTRFELSASGVDNPAESAVRDRLPQAADNNFAADRFQGTREGETFKATGLYTVPVTEADIRRALATPLSAGDSALNLKDLKITVAPEPRTGENAVAIALIQSQQLRPEQLDEIKTQLASVGGGIVDPLYQANSIGPSVAAEVTANAFWSVVVASLAIVLYLAFRFAIGGFLNGLKFGTCAVIALVHDVGITIGLFALMGWLAGWQVDSLFVTAALTILGFSVHDTIVVYDRIRENLLHRRKGETFAEISDRSITQTFDRSLNTSFTVLLVIAALVVFGGESIRLFNIALLFGVAIGTYSSIFVASPLVVSLEQRLASQETRSGAAAAPRSSRRDDAPLTPARRERPSAPATSSRTATVERPAVDTESAADTETTGADRSKSSSIKPRRKRRM